MLAPGLHLVTARRGRQALREATTCNALSTTSKAGARPSTRPGWSTRPNSSWSRRSSSPH